jgi:hypothetical protein
MFAYHRNALVYMGGLDSGHWLQPLVRNLNVEACTLTLADETHGAQFRGDWVWVYVRFCRAYTITVGADSVEIGHQGLYTGNANNDGIEEAAIIPLGDLSGDVLQQVSSYRSEFDDFQDGLLATDQDQFRAFAVANTTADPAAALEALLPNFCGCPPLYGKAFTLALDAEGKVAAVDLLDSVAA